MRVAPVLAAVVALSLHAAAAQQESQKRDPDRVSIQVTGCANGSTLIESNLRMESQGADPSPERRWRLRGPKALMNRIKQHAGKELEISGTTKNPRSGMVIGGKRIGKTNIYIGGNADKTGAARDPLPDLPTIDVESFEPTGESCR